MDDSSLTILLIANGYPPGVGGWEVYNGEFARRLANRGHTLEVFTWGRRDRVTEASDAKSLVPVYRSRGGRRGRDLEPKGLDSILERLRPDVALVSGGSKALVRAIGAAARRVPVVLSVHDLRDEGRGRGRLVRAWYRRRYAFHRATRIIANSHDTLDRIRTLGVRSEILSVVYPGVDVEHFAGDDALGSRFRETLRLECRKVLLTVAALRRIKGHARVIDLLPALRERFPDILYVIVGRGKLRSELMRRAKERGVADCVRFAGRVPDVRPYLHACDLLVMPSVPKEPRARAAEGFGIAYAEAAACGKPAIASTSGGGGEIVVDGETGYLVAPGDEAGLERAISDLLIDPARCRAMGERARQRVERFDWERGVDALERVLREAAFRR